jgi:hypothetical protein
MTRPAAQACLKRREPMKRQLYLALVALVAVGALLPGVQRSLSQAPAIATIHLPEPGVARELYAGCNLVSLTFPDGTASDEVIDAVTPPEAVETIWRQTATLDRFEGFSPDFPQASDLLAVHFLDPVWICTPKTLGPPPAPAADTSTPTPVGAPPAGTPTPTPVPQATADLVLSSVNLQRPQGIVWIWLTNYGPDSLVNATVQLQCSTGAVDPFDGNLVAGGGFQGPISVTVAAKGALQVTTPLTIDVSKAAYQVVCEFTNESFIDPDPSNNKEGRGFDPLADLALTDIFPQSLPDGELYVRITNNGPDSLVNAPAHLKCSYTATRSTGQTWTKANPLSLITVSLKPGETKEFDALLQVATSCSEYDVECELWPYFDPKSDNNKYSETIPLSGGVCIE